MLTLRNIAFYFFEGLAVSASLYLLARPRLGVAEMIIMALSISVTFLILDLFAPGIASGARQGTGFGLGLKQVGGNFYQTQNNEHSRIISNLNDRDNIGYYERKNRANQSQQNLLTNAEIHDQQDSLTKFFASPQHQFAVDAQIPSPILDKMNQKWLSEPNRSTQTEYGSQNIDIETTPLLYSPLKPTYGHRYQFPRGWDELEQDKLYKTFNTQNSKLIGQENVLDDYEHNDPNKKL